MYLMDLAPWLVVLVVIAGSTGGVLLFRWLFERELYERSRASVPGDQFLALYCGIIAYIYQTDLPSGWYLDWQWMFGLRIFCVSAAVGLHWLAMRNLRSRAFSCLPAQIYHNLFVVPMLLYIVLSTLPMLYLGRFLWLQLAALACLLIWAGLLVWDIRHGNLVQKTGPGMDESGSPQVDLSCSELLSEHAALLNEYGPWSSRVSAFEDTHKDVPGFAQLAKTARHLKAGFAYGRKHWD